MDGVDLIPSTRRELQRRRMRVRTWIAAGCAYAAMLGGTLVGAAAAWPRDQETPAAALAAVSAENEQHRALVKQMSAEIAHKQRELAANRAVGNQPDWSILLAIVAEALGPDAALREAHLTTEVVAGPTPQPAAGQPATQPDAEPRRSFSLLVSGIAKSQRAVNDVVQRLEGTGLFERIVLIETRREGADRKGDLTAFQFRCQLGPERKQP